ncbi:hypothetical protein HHK36_010586 [Tetracentron sinense]|uniref:Small auxin up regulated protein n=1 Tax=Tetracentron sinense TaxID=13715 RepID=A0A834ZEL2_TETSI|nr:hypothetical protein HHK36_010586 [Tetracentron sinense]
MFPIRVVGRRLGSLMKKLHLKKRKECVRMEKSKHSRVPEGSLPIYVGEERMKFVVPLKCLSSTMFQALLNQFEDEIDAKVEGPIAIPCSTQMFQWVLDLAKAEESN